MFFQQMPTHLSQAAAVYQHLLLSFSSWDLFGLFFMGSVPDASPGSSRRKELGKRWGQRRWGDEPSMEVNPERQDWALIRIQGSLRPFPESEQGWCLQQACFISSAARKEEQSQKSRRKMLCKIVHLLLIGRLRAQCKPPNKTGLDKNFLNPRLSE